jgi:hypothetical protein
MPVHGDKQELSVLEKLQPYMSQRLERALEELELTEEYVVFRLGGLEIHRVRRATRSRRWRWSRWVSLFGVLAALLAGIIKVWLTS